MGTGVSAGAAYNKLEKTDNEISKGLQYWGGITAQQIEGDKNRAAKKAEDDANRKEREGVRKDTDVEKYKFDFTSKSAGFDSLTDMYSDFSRQAADHYGELSREYATVPRGSTRARELENQMQKVQTAFKEQQGATETFKQLYDAYDAKARAGSLSQYEEDNWRMIQGMAKGTTKDTFLKYDRDNVKGIYIHNELNPDGTPSEKVIDMNQIRNGIFKPIDKIDIDSKDGMINHYVALMGTFKNEYYKNNKDITEAGYTKYAKDNIRTSIFNDLDESEVKDLSAQFFQVKSGLDSKEKLLDAKNKVVDELTKRVMMTEDTSYLSKLNLDQAKLNEEIRSNKAREAIAKQKPQDDVTSMAQRVSYDAEQAMNGEVSGMVGVIITSPDKKQKRTSIGATDLGKEFVIRFDDGSTQRVPKTKQGIVNFIAQSDNLAGGRDKGLVETAIREKGVQYDRQNTYGNIGAGLAEGLSAIKKSGTGNDKKAATILQSSLPEGWRVENADNGWINNDLKIIPPDDSEPIIIDYKSEYSKREAQNKLDKWEQQNSGGSSSTIDVDALIDKYK